MGKCRATLSIFLLERIGIDSHDFCHLGQGLRCKVFHQLHEVFVDQAARPFQEKLRRVGGLSLLEVGAHLINGSQSLRTGMNAQLRN